MPPPAKIPIGLALTRTAKVVERAFDDALAAAGSSRPTWLILMALKSAQPRTQTDLAATVGIREATLSHHLNGMVRDALVTRERSPQDRRVHQVSLTDAGHELFLSLADAARAHDRRLRGQLNESQLTTLRTLLEQLARNVTPP